MPYQNIYKGHKGTCRFDLAKDCFILSFCLMGINSVDLYNATELKGNKLVYYRTKTKDRRLDKAKMEESTFLVNNPQKRGCFKIGTSSFSCLAIGSQD